MPYKVDWARSEAKEIVLADLKSGALPYCEEKVSDDEAWDRYKNMVEFADVKAAQFKSNLRRYRSMGPPTKIRKVSGRPNCFFLYRFQDPLMKDHAFVKNLVSFCDFQTIISLLKSHPQVKRMVVQAMEANEATLLKDLPMEAGYKYDDYFSGIDSSLKISVLSKDDEKSGFAKSQKAMMKSVADSCDRNGYFDPEHHGESIRQRKARFQKKFKKLLWECGSIKETDFLAKGEEIGDNLPWEVHIEFDKVKSSSSVKKFVDEWRKYTRDCEEEEQREFQDILDAFVCLLELADPNYIRFTSLKTKDDDSSKLETMDSDFAVHFLTKKGNKRIELIGYYHEENAK